MFIDVHCHLELLDEENDLGNVVQGAREFSVLKIIGAGTDKRTNRFALLQSNKFKEIECALGIYPSDALKMTDKEIDSEIEFIRENTGKIKAIGEVGMDYKEAESEEDRERQREIFKKFILLSKELDLPLIVHSRQAEKECIELLEKMNCKKVVMHCFSGNLKLVERIRNNDWYFSIPSSCKRSMHFQNIIKNVGIDRLLCETDSPFLHPDGSFKEVNGKSERKINEPMNVIASYQKIAEIKEIGIKKVEREIEGNYKGLFLS